MKDRFVITGTGRSGTGYICKLLNELGVKCGHESIFKPDTKNVDFRDYSGDSSWLAAPFISKFDSNIMVFHQVRDPILVVRSFVGMGFFDDEPDKSHYPYLKFIRQTKEVSQLGSVIERALFHWVSWNKYVENEAAADNLRYYRYQIEELTPMLIKDNILSLIGCEKTLDEIENAINKISKKTNRRQRDSSIKRESLYDYSISEEFVALANRYGYDY